MIRAQEFITELTGKFLGQLLSDYRPAPADIDIYIDSKNYAAVKQRLFEERFVLTRIRSEQIVARRFENGELIILDLLADFNLYTDSAPFLQLTQAGNQRLGRSAVLHACFKALCLNNRRKLPLLEENWQIFSEFLGEAAYFVRPDKGMKAVLQRDALALFNYVAAKTFWRRIISSCRERFCRLGRGKSFVFVGPDGSGKSFFIEKLRGIGLTAPVYMGDWFFILQPFYTFVVKNVPSPWNRIVHPFYFAENLLRLARVLSYRFMGYIVLIDRFPGTNRSIAGGRALVAINKLIFRLFPKPDEFIFLYARPEVIHRRKNELTVEAIDLQQQRMEMMLADIHYRKLNTEQLDDALNMILAVAYDPLRPS